MEKGRNFSVSVSIFWVRECGWTFLARVGRGRWTNSIGGCRWVGVDGGIFWVVGGGWTFFIGGCG